MNDKIRNVLLVLTDQQKRATCGAYGNSIIGTPNLDAFAGESAVFDNAICSQPVCSPSRASLFSGLYPHSHGVVKNTTPLPYRIPTLGERLSDRGYRTGYIGKWHVGGTREVLPQRGFEECWRAVDDNYTRRRDLPLFGYSAYYQYLRQQNILPEEILSRQITREEAAVVPEEHTKAAFIASEACKFLETRKDQPFFLTCAFLEPHPPFHGPYDDFLNRSALELPPNFIQSPRPDWTRRNIAYQKFSGIDHGSETGKSTEDDWRDVTARYYGLMKLYDKYLGVILKQVEDLGLAGNTLVVVTSDHGEMLAEHGMLYKGPMFEGCLGVPFMVRGPGISAGRRIAQAVSLVDLAPTFFDMLDLGVPAEFQGQSLACLLRGGADDLERTTFAEWNGQLQAMHGRQEFFKDCAGDHVRVARTSRFKLTVTPGDTAEFYDLQDDPWEMTNRIHDPACRSKIIELFDSILEWQKRTGDPLALHSCL